ncbi:hypothetical protein HY498_00085 [Candidatus Woesearchaeota archaeon]|nr:hypothetical protein [Candidatus Woesearchaeota archaeon]
MVLKVKFEKDLEQKFRELAMRRYGFSRGAIKKASEEAISRWIREEGGGLPKVKDPIKAIRGALKHLRGKYTSVELQHEATKLWAEQD